MNYDKIVESITYGHVPRDEEWLASDGTGWTVAHYYVQSHILPEHFPYWGIKDESGWSVAHSAAYNKKLPNSFRRWEIADKHNDTVAHIAARKGILPSELYKNNRIMMLKNNSGETVWNICKQKGSRALKEMLEMLKNEK